MNTEITIVVNSSKNEIIEFEDLAVGDYFLYERLLYQKINATAEFHHCNAVRVQEGMVTLFKSYHEPIKLVKNIKIEYST